MSLPKELLDQLLTGYLDDALTADERVRVEQLLESNAVIADELEQLRDLRQSLQVLSKVDSDIKLDQGFADRVLGAAVARAREEGLADDHPLIRLAEQPSTSPAVASPKTTSWRAVAIIVGLAASIVIAVFVLRPQTEADPSMIAKSDPAPIESPSFQVTPKVVEPGANAELGPMLVQDEPPQRTTRAVEPQVTHVVPDEAVAVSAETREVMPVEPKVADATAGTSFAYVFTVRRTDAGRRSDAMSKALRGAGIFPSSRIEVTDQLAAFVADQVTGDIEDASLMHLRLPGKQVELLEQQLELSLADEEGIESYQSKAVFNAPLMPLSNPRVTDPTAIRNDTLGSGADIESHVLIVVW